VIINPVPGGPENDNREGRVDDEKDSGDGRRQPDLIVLKSVFVDVESGEHGGVQRTASGHDISWGKDLQT
jgi:hypothetical protein